MNRLDRILYGFSDEAMADPRQRILLAMCAVVGAVLGALWS